MRERLSREGRSHNAHPQLFVRRQAVSGLGQIGLPAGKCGRSQIAGFDLYLHPLDEFFAQLAERALPRLRLNRHRQRQRQLRTGARGQIVVFEVGMVRTDREGDLL